MIARSNYVCRSRGRSIYARKYTNVFLIRHRAHRYKDGEYDSGYAELGILFVDKEFIGKRFRLKLEWLDD